MKKTPPFSSAPRQRQFGMSLIEIMIGVLVGLIGCVVIFQMYSVAEGRKRTVASGSDMDISGRLGLMTLERDIQLAGYGLGAAAALGAGGLLGCSVTAYDSQRPGGAQDFNFPLVPVAIQDGAAGAPDTLVTLRGSSNFAVTPKIIDNSTADTKRIKADTGGRTGVQRGDVVIATKVTGGLACAMLEITGDGNADQLTFDHLTAANYTTAAGQQRTARYNKAGGIGFALTDEGNLYSLGIAPARMVWTVQNNKLVVTNDLVYTNGVPIEAADLIVDLQAQYGVDADNNGMISAGEWTNVDPVDWRLLLGVRFALLARSTQFEQTKVTPTAANPRWSAGPFTMRNIDGTADTDPGGSNGDVNNWRNYRYNVFEAVVPLRNNIFGRAL
jgi:type IV pilus assembly protein PilW